MNVKITTVIWRPAFVTMSTAEGKTIESFAEPGVGVMNCCLSLLIWSHGLCITILIHIVDSFHPVSKDVSPVAVGVAKLSRSR